MTLSIILLAAIALGAYLMRKYDFDVLGHIIGIVVCLFCGIWLTCHLSCFILVERDYNIFVIERNAFEQTLKDSREGGNDYEAAAIVQEVARYNIRLSMEQYNNKNAFLGQYIDDRIEDLKPIK